MNSLTELYLRQSINYERDEINVLKTKVKYLETQEFALVTDVVTLSVIDAKGDLLVGSADNAIDNLAVGTNAYTLIADSLQTLGIRWGQLATGGITDLAVTTAKIDNLAVTTGKLTAASVTNDKLRNSGALSVIGRSINSAGAPADISAVAASGAVLRENGSNIDWGTIVAAGIASDAITTIKILDANVTNAKLANMVQNTVKGRALGAGTGVPTDLTVTQLNALWGSADSFNASNVVTLGAASDEGRGQMGTTPLKLKGSAALLAYRESADSQGVNIEFLKRRSGTATVLQSGDQIGSLTFTGADTTTFGAVAARIMAEVDGAPGSADMPGRIVFQTSPDGTATPTEAMRINALQNLIIANGKRIESDEVRARDAGGLALLDDGSNYGIFIKDGGFVQIGGGTNPSVELVVGDDLGAFAGSKRITVGNASGASALNIGVDNNNRGFLYWNNTVNQLALAALVGGSQANGIFQLAPNGGVVGIGLGTNVPQGLLHGHNGTGGFLFTTKSAVAGTAIVIIANGTGDVTDKVNIRGQVTDSTGVKLTMDAYIAVSGNTTLDFNSGGAPGTQVLTFAVSAAGELTVQRTAGTRTYTMDLFMLWR